MGGIGLEPTTSAMSKQCSNQLSYPPEGLTLYRMYQELTMPVFKHKSDAKGFTGENHLIGQNQTKACNERKHHIKIEAGCRDNRH